MPNAPISATSLDFTITCSPSVAAAARGLTAIKADLDVMSRTNAGSAILGQLFPTWKGYESPEPYSFAALLLPFYWYARSLEPTKLTSVRYKALVPTELVVGHSWRWLPSSLNDVEQGKVIDRAFSSFEASTPSHARSECAEYCYIRPLGLVIAHEGKNRVALFRHKALPHIPAVVSEEDYPHPDRLRIFEMPEATLAVLDNRFVERVAALNLVHTLMEAYGIKVERHWPADFADLQQVLSDLNDSSMRNDYESYAADMDKLQLDAACSETWVKARLLDIEAVGLPPLTSYVKGGVFFLLLLTISLIGEEWPGLQSLAAFAAGALITLLMGPLLPLFRCKVRHLKNSERNNWFLRIRQDLMRKPHTMNKK